MHKTNNTYLQTKNTIPLEYILSYILCFFYVLNSSLNIIFRNTLYPTPEIRNICVPNDIINILVIFPITLISMILAKKNNLIALFAWAGSILIILYNCVANLIIGGIVKSSIINGLMIVLCIVILIKLLIASDTDKIYALIHTSIPEKTAGGIIAGLGLLFSVRAVVIIITLLQGRSSLSLPEVGATIADLVICPVWITSGILLILRRKTGYASIYSMYFNGCLLFITLIIYLVLKPLITHTPFPLTDIIVICVMSLVCIIPFIILHRNIMKKIKE